jgi:hypothetical protein
MFATTLTDEYRAVARICGLDVDGVARLVAKRHRGRLSSPTPVRSSSWARSKPPAPTGGSDR